MKHRFINPLNPSSFFPSDCLSSISCEKPPTNSSQFDQLTGRNEWDKTLHCEFEQRLLNYSKNYS